MLEIRILSGARAGQVDRFDKPVVVVGRHATVDLRFSPEKDLDVSGRHAEIRLDSGRYSLHDSGSTNGTFVNGHRINAGGSVELKDGDTVRFGAKGPDVEIRTDATSAMDAPRPKARSTEERIAVAVTQQTKGLKIYMTAAVIVLVSGLGAVYYVGTRESRGAQAAGATPVADSLAGMLQGGTRGDTTVLRKATQMDLPTIHTQNSPAVALLVSEINGKSFAGSGFSISSEGLLVTNRHNVRDESGKAATRIAVKFTNTKEWLPAHVVKVSDVPGEDLALIQMDHGGPFPVVQGVSTGGTDATEGNSVVTIGFPLGYDTPMEGEGNDFIAKSTLNPGTVSKRTSSVLQIDSYAAHGSSGSPVFNTRGLVVGVVWGGPPEGGGRIVYAVPPDRVAAFIPAELKTIIKD